MNDRWTKGSVLATALALLLLGIGVNCLVDGHRIRRNFAQWQVAKPVDGVVDFSEPGPFVLPFEQTCSSAHAEMVSLSVPPEAMQGTTATQLLAGLNLQIRIASPSGDVVVQSAEFDLGWAERAVGSTIPLFRFSPFKKGTYTATVTVTDGAPALKGTVQRLLGSYELCGLELLPATIATGLGWGSTGLGGVIGLVVALRVSRERKAPLASQPDPALGVGSPSEPSGASETHQPDSQRTPPSNDAG
jgi:hypothetical protein